MPNPKESSDSINTRPNASSSEDRDYNSSVSLDPSLLPLGEGTSFVTDESSEEILSYYDPVSKKLVYYYDPGSTSEGYEYTSTDEDEVDDSKSNSVSNDHAYFQLLPETQHERNGLESPKQEKHDPQLSSSPLQFSIFNGPEKDEQSRSLRLGDKREERHIRKWKPY